MYITIDGIDGVGKSTQIPLITKWLEDNNKEVITTREPGGTPLGAKLRKLIMSGSNKIGYVNTPLADLFLMLADRAFNNVENKNLYKSDTVVISDRGVDSMIAYQAFGEEDYSMSEIQMMNKHFLVPDITFLIRVPLEESLKRATKKNKFEAKGIEYYKRVQYGYTLLARENPKRIKVIDGSKSIEDVTKQITDHLEAMI